MGIETIPSNPGQEQGELRGEFYFRSLQPTAASPPHLGLLRHLYGDFLYIAMRNCNNTTKWGSKGGIDINPPADQSFAMESFDQPHSPSFTSMLVCAKSIRSEIAVPW